MAGDPVLPCPACGSFLTGRASLGGMWECRYCAALFPVELRPDAPCRVAAAAEDAARVSSRGSS
ncbi:MAG TPA: hypothetical protein VLV30_09210 [Methanomicrobiales archaeon]|nr:hypothetical protein [Methanomicrobiales archaeon]